MKIQGTKRILVAAGALLFVGSTLYGAGFGIFEQGSKATGMGGVFTATADDPSAMFYNPAGLAFQTDKEVMLGPTLIIPSSDFKGANPYPGRANRESQKSAVFTPASLYYAQPIGSKVAVGIAVMTPFGLATEWKNRDTYSGRFISQRADLQSISIQPTVAFKLGQSFSLGIGAEYRTSSVILEKNVGAVNPFTQQVVDVGHVKLESTGTNADWGFTVGLLYKPLNSVRFGLSYRHHIDVDYDGKARFTQISTGNPELDAVVASQIPFDEKIDAKTGIAFPSLASFGVAVDVYPDTTIEVDADWAGWNRFESVDINLVGHEDLNSSIPEGWENAWNFRLGFEQRLSGGLAVRLGYVYDNTPQPRWGIGPLLPDRDRVGYSVGLGQRIGGFGYDLAYMYLVFRDANTMGQNRDGYNGVYDNTAHLIGIHLAYHF